MVLPSRFTLITKGTPYYFVVTGVVSPESLFFSLYLLFAALNWSVISRLVMIRSTSPKKS